MKRRYCTAWTALAILAVSALLAALAVHAAAPESPAAPENPGTVAVPQAGSDFATAQGRPGPVGQAGPANASPAPGAQPLASANRPDLTDEQIGAAITHGVDFLLSNFNKFELK